ncbi:hypothetical protein [Halomonas sp. HAL1]|uniref:pilus assembly PilX family protein n=1 Tax=Halomonas sp. HAL1 TaxID=550984 RepID=UPI00022D2D21|nr:hypothetical protein [Halomonas sp. HAL1]EHA14359.1 hypothetical protein HAL1_16876 [Halomonas sp. HAL1]WKV92385.1 hypothetical protein Q3Y66_16275 [Halomonas sp. HAL1]
MNNQQGAALVVVMALLSGSLMLGMSGMQSALIDEQLAGNYRASVQAKMNSDSMMSEFRKNESQSLLDEIYNTECENNASCYEEYERNILDSLEGIEGLGSIVKAVKVEKNNDEIIITMIDQGTNNDAVGETVATYKKGSEDVGLGGDDNDGEGNDGDSGGASSLPFESPIVGCEGVQSSGGSTFSSYNSGVGGWVEGQPGSFAEQDIPLVRTTSANANVVLGGSEHIHGGIEALGTVTLNGSSKVFGSILANQTIYLNAGGGYVQRNAESRADVIFGSSTRVDGVVRAQGIVSLTWGASVGKGIYAQRGVSSPGDPQWNPPEGHIDEDNRSNFFPHTSVSISEIDSQPCDIVDFAGNTLSEEIARYQNDLASIGDVVVNDGVVDITMTPSSISVSGSDIHEHVNGAVPSDDTLFGEAARIYYVDDLNMASKSKLQITGGNVVLVVGGDFTMGGGGAGLVIDIDSSLTVFVAGKVNFGSVLNIEPEVNSINSNGQATFSLFSGYQGSGSGVDFNSSNRVVANVYAPYTNVSVNSGANFFGSVRGRSVNVSGDGSIVYDELLGGAFGNPDDVWDLIGWQ